MFLLNVKAMIVVLVTALIMFALLKPMFLRFMDAEDFRGRRILWFVHSSAAFLAPSFWIYFIVALPTLIWAARRDSNPIAPLALHRLRRAAGERRHSAAAGPDVHDDQPGADARHVHPLSDGYALPARRAPAAIDDGQGDGHAAAALHRLPAHFGVSVRQPDGRAATRLHAHARQLPRVLRLQPLHHEQASARRCHGGLVFAGHRDGPAGDVRERPRVAALHVDRRGLGTGQRVRVAVPRRFAAVAADDGALDRHGLRDGVGIGLLDVFQERRQGDALRLGGDSAAVRCRARLILSRRVAAGGDAPDPAVRAGTASISRAIQDADRRGGRRLRLLPDTVGRKDC